MLPVQVVSALLWHAADVCGVGQFRVLHRRDVTVAVGEGVAHGDGKHAQVDLLVARIAGTRIRPERKAHEAADQPGGLIDTIVGGYEQGQIFAGKGADAGDDAARIVEYPDDIQWRAGGAVGALATTQVDGCRQFARDRCQRVADRYGAGQHGQHAGQRRVGAADDAAQHDALRVAGAIGPGHLDTHRLVARTRGSTVRFSV